MCAFEACARTTVTFIGTLEVRVFVPFFQKVFFLKSCSSSFSVFTCVYRTAV